VSRALAETGRPLDPGSSTALTVADLELARRRAGIEYRSGDVVVIRTGFLEWYLKQDLWVRDLTTTHRQRGWFSTVRIAPCETSCS